MVYSHRVMSLVIRFVIVTLRFVLIVVPISFLDASHDVEHEACKEPRRVISISGRIETEVLPFFEVVACTSRMRTKSAGILFDFIEKSQYSRF